MPKKSKPAKRQSKGVTGDECRVTRKEKAVGRESSRAVTPKPELRNPKFIAPSHFELREDGQIVGVSGPGSRLSGTNSLDAKRQTPDPQFQAPDPITPKLVYHDDARKSWLYQGNSLELLDAIAAKYHDGRFDAIFADPPYFLSNGGITCHAGELHFRRSQLALTA